MSENLLYENIRFVLFAETSIRSMSWNVKFDKIVDTTCFVTKLLNKHGNQLDESPWICQCPETCKIIKVLIIHDIMLLPKCWITKRP